ncbi:Ferric reduction oxidase 6 [Psilocybe cubensis]|uniref:Ferric reduction oxidase 6 n=1 Tax=Psilocybe cubensis TaxID=181762 RepID=A0ACB8GKC3_PSICU|nr:Ferric reduction oxidase 6 [Psilocybe cubensis]KAH9475842.1 Ferric reduction oxidase 6 [Psilocybe cubensis]
MPSLSLSSPPAPPSPVLNSNSMHHAAQPLSRRTLPSPEHAADAALVTHILLLLTALFLLAILLRLPRALALFGGVSREWAAGHMFWYDRRVAAVAPSRRTRRGRRGTLSNNNPHNLNHNHGNREHNGSGEEKDQGVPRARPYPALHFPPHIPSCPSLLRGLLAPLRARVPFLSSTRGGAGMGMGHALLLAVYFYAWVYAALFRSNVFTDPARTGWIAAAQVPVVCALAGKNGVGWLGGWGYEKDPSNTWGMVALVSVNTIFLFSVQSVRNSAYNLFLATHILGFILVLPAMYLHKPSLLPYVLFAAAFLALDHTLRLCKSRYTSAYITPLPELEMTRVEIPSINAGWRAGQHVRLRVLAPWGGRGGGGGWRGGMGLGKCLEVHPFTIANVARKEGGEGMVLMCKKAGGWTGALYALAKSSSSSSSPASLEAGCPQEKTVGMGMGMGLGKEVKVIVEGPYGGPGHVNFASFSAAVFVVGGSGITYALAAIEDLVRKDGKGESRVKVVELVWIVADPACLAPLLPTFTKLISQSLYTPLRISVFYTRAPIGKQPAFFDASSSSPSSFSSSSSSPPASPTASPSGPAPAYTHSSAPLATVAEAHGYMGESSANANAKLRRGDSARARFADPAHDDRVHGHGHDGNDNGNGNGDGNDDEDDDDDDVYAPSVHSQDQNQHEFDSYARPQRAHESAHAHVRNASGGVNAVAGPSAAAIMHGQMQSHHLQPQPQQSTRGHGPQRQDSSASARTLVGRENSTKSAHYHYRSKSISKSRARTPQPQVQIQAQGYGQTQGYGQAQGQGQGQALPRGLTLAPGRPKLSKFLEHALQRAITLSHGNFKDNYDDTTSTGKGGLSGMVVGVCGPGGLADDVVACVGSLDVRRRERVGGVEVCEEVFGW